MRIERAFLLGALALVTACEAVESPTQPDFDQVVAEARPDAAAACSPTDLEAVQDGLILRHDCLFGDGQREDLFRVDQLALGLPDLSGAHMLTFTPEATFDGIFGVSNWDATTFGVPVYGFQTFQRRGTRTMSLVGSSPEYKLFFSGADATSYGKYTLTTTVEPSANSCETGSRTFLQGTVAFSSAISDGTSCAGEVTVGPNVGQPLIYQFWYAKLQAGQEVTVSVDGVDGDDASLTLAAIVFGSPFALLDFSAGAGDTDRALTFTAPFEAYYYIEVSASPGVSSPYELSFSSD